MTERLPTSRTLFSLLALAATLLSGCATVVTVPRMKPAEVNLAGYTRVAVGGVYGEDGDSMTRVLTEALFATQRYEVLDRQHLDEVFGEQDLAASGAVSDETAAALGNVIGAAALITGDVTSQTYQESVNATETTCTADGKTFPCTRFTRTATAKLDVSLKVLDTTSGQVLAIKSLTGMQRQSKKATGSEPPPFNARAPWLEACRKSVATDFMKVIAPHQVQVKVELAEDGDLPELETGNNYAKLGKWNEAASQYSAAVARAANMSNSVKAKAHYNLGLAHGLSGRYDEGIRELETSFALDPDGKTQAQIRRLQQFKADDEELERQKQGNYDAGGV